jgi:predicted alpha-1,2-mannosidase
MKSSIVFISKISGFVLIISFFISCEKNHTMNSTNVRPVDLVYPQLDTENSRWFFFSSACRPFGMVNLSPDTETNGTWGSGYKYKSDTVQGFSHIHAWQISGISVMPVVISKTNRHSIFKDFYSKFSHKTEKIAPGYHYLELDRYKITVGLTSTKRVGFHKYVFQKPGQPAILFNLNGILGPCEMVEGTLELTANNTLCGKVVNAPNQRRPKPLTVFFQIVLNTEIESIIRDKNSGNYLVKIKDTENVVLMKAGISYTSARNAANNIKAELPHWNFENTVNDSKNEWNSLLSRIKVKGGTLTSRQRFYTDLWHALQGRRTISDVNGAYPDNTGEHFRIGQLPLNEKGIPKFSHYNSDSFWGAQWTLNTLWGLVYPEIMEDFVHSLLQYYEDGGMIPRGPSGGNYTYVMTGASTTPFIVSAIQKGIIKDNIEYIYNALKKNHLPGGIMEKAGYEHNSSYGGGFDYYLENGFVPYPIPEGEFGNHQDGAGLTLEYAYQDWTLAQLAKKLGHADDFQYFLKRSQNYQYVFDKQTGWMRPRNVAREWLNNFDPYLYENGFNESNAAQSTWFVPHDIAGLAKLMGGEEQAVEKLNEQFRIAESKGFTAGDSHDRELHPEFKNIPINYGNQPSIHTAFIFHKLNRPDLTQFWARKILEAAFSGLSTATGYNGDEDQGLMGSLAVLMKIGLFQLNGGTEENPVYQIGSPIFDRITIELNPDYYPGKTFVITVKNNNRENIYVNKSWLNNQVLKKFSITHSQITNGGELLLEMAGRF